jgi:hypothetical protein
VSQQQPVLEHRYELPVWAARGDCIQKSFRRGFPDRSSFAYAASRFVAIPIAWGRFRRYNRYNSIIILAVAEMEFDCNPMFGGRF